jgi:hypothetical protein
MGYTHTWPTMSRGSLPTLLLLWSNSWDARVNKIGEKIPTSWNVHYSRRSNKNCVCLCNKQQSRKARFGVVGIVDREGLQLQGCKFRKGTIQAKT